MCEKTTPRNLEHCAILDGVGNRQDSLFAAFPYSCYTEVLVVGLSEWAKAHFFIGTDMNRAEKVAKIGEIAERVAQPEGIEIVEIDLKGGGRNQVLVVIIDRPPDGPDKPGGVTHGDCEFISQQVGTILDVEDLIPGTYQLEVSSPGVERKLMKWKDWTRFVGEKAKVVLKEPVAVAEAKAPLKHFDGVITKAEDQAVTMSIAGGEVTFPFDQVDRANLKFEW
jgi:ribosome maturation factor RimP